MGMKVCFGLGLLSSLCVFFAESFKTRAAPALEEALPNAAGSELVCPQPLMKGKGGAEPQLMKFVEGEQSALLQDLGKLAPCQTFRIFCGSGISSPCQGHLACVKWDTCEMQIPTSMCARCFSENPGFKTPAEIQACARQLTPESLGCNTPEKLVDLCIYRHEAIHTGQDVSQMRLCAAEQEAWQDTVACYESWCQACPSKCQENQGLGELRLAQAALAMSKCACSRNILVGRGGADLWEEIGTTFHCGLCRASCGLSLKCAFFEGDACGRLARFYCRDFPHHQQQWSGTIPQNSDQSPQP